MRLATVSYGGNPRVVVDRGDGLSLLNAVDVPDALSRGVFTDPTPLIDSDMNASEPLVFLPLVSAPSNVICVGHNYRAHILELGHDLPRYPNVFNKLTASLVGAEDPIILSSRAEEWDWEAELALVVGRHVYDATPAEADRAIAGYTIANDISARDWQRRTSQWLLGKTFAKTTPLGPWLVPTTEFDPEQPHTITCHVDGMERQRSVTSDLLFTARDLVSYVSQVLPLQPGDVILTGTPGGVGMAMQPRTFLKPGQEVVTTIEGLGQCRNRCVAAMDQDGK
jgi:acylpyruvate hydrolase